jgi:crotonobetainyl-CoA:carnitine CoA-transferase CaiB-like acyl-CoA transferase
VPYETFPSADGWFILATGNDTQFLRVWSLLGLRPDARFATNPQRVAARDEIGRLIALATRSWRRDDLLARLEELGVPAGPINTVAQALSDPQILSRRMILDIARAGAPSVPGIRTPIRFSDAELALGRASPALPTAA